jgi:hypothetical protein
MKTDLIDIIDAIDTVRHGMRVPQKIIMSTSYFEELSASIPSTTSTGKYDTICGIPIEIDDSIDGWEIEYKFR